MNWITREAMLELFAISFGRHRNMANKVARFLHIHIFSILNFR